MDHRTRLPSFFDSATPLDTSINEYIQKDGTKLLLTRLSFWGIVREWKNLWEKYYLPSSGVQGKSVLDVGSGCGETAYFYLMHGAVKVVCVEPNLQASTCLKANVKKNAWPVEVLEDFFVPSMLEEYHSDFMKFDAEGAESLLLECEKIPECVLEYHSQDVKMKLQKKFDLKPLFQEKDADLGLLASF